MTTDILGETWINTDKNKNINSHEFVKNSKCFC